MFLILSLSVFRDCEIIRRCWNQITLTCLHSRGSITQVTPMSNQSGFTSQVVQSVLAKLYFGLTQSVHLGCHYRTQNGQMSPVTFASATVINGNISFPSAR